MKIKEITKRQWINFSLWSALFIAGAIWSGSWWLLLAIIVLTDIYLTKYINWGAWKHSKNPAIQKVLNWIDDILFALIAVYIINLFLFQNYQIPSSSLEKTLLVGDFLYVSKLSYGPRVPNTPLSFPLVQNTLPILNCKSYFEWPLWGYKRLKGSGTVQRDDIVVFNFPAGDTVLTKMQNPDYYIIKKHLSIDEIKRRKADFGEIIWRPVDKRENYVKRCIGLPGDSLQIIQNQVYINGVALENRKNVQFAYYVETDGTPIKEEMFRRLHVSKDDRIQVGRDPNYSSQLSSLGLTGRNNPVYRLPLTAEALSIVKKMPSTLRVVIEPPYEGEDVYPLNYRTGWTRDDYGPIWIPRKGATIDLTPLNIALYERCICNYEGNTFARTADGSCLINGEKATSYTFKYDYYWMMGDNRHNSADSRAWGFVPEDHIVGKPLFVWLSLDKDRSLFDGRIRWNRLFHSVESFN